MTSATPPDAPSPLDTAREALADARLYILANLPPHVTERPAEILATIAKALAALVPEAKQPVPSPDQATPSQGDVEKAWKLIEDHVTYHGEVGPRQIFAQAIANTIAAARAESRAEVAQGYDSKLGEITDQDREYAEQLLEDISDPDDPPKVTAAQWLRKVRYEAVMADREKRQATPSQGDVDWDAAEQFVAAHVDPDTRVARTGAMIDAVAAALTSARAESRAEVDGLTADVRQLEAIDRIVGRTPVSSISTLGWVQMLKEGAEAAEASARKAGEEMRERCAALADGWSAVIAHGIRALPLPGDGEGDNREKNGRKPE